MSRQFDATFVALKLQQVSNMFETPAISRRQIALKIAGGLHVRFWSCKLSATKIASSCRDKNLLCKRAFKLHNKTTQELYKRYTRRYHETLLILTREKLLILIIKVRTESCLLNFAAKFGLFCSQNFSEKKKQTVKWLVST